MTSVNSSVVGVLVCLGIALILLIGLISYNFARGRSIHSSLINTAQREEKDSPMPENSDSIIMKKEFPAPWRAKVWTEALPPASQLTADAENSSPKFKNRQTPVIVRTAGATERPVVKKSSVTTEGNTK